jgi:hypothetical protein
MQLRSFRDCLTVLHCADPSCEPLIRQCDTIGRLLLEPPSLATIPELPEKVLFFDRCAELCNRLSLSLDGLLAAIGALRDAVEAAAPLTSAECTSVIDTIRANGSLEPYWAFFGAHAEVLSRSEFSEILKKIEYMIVVGQIIERGRVLLNQRAVIVDSPTRIDDLAERATRLMREFRALQPSWKRFETHIQVQIAAIQKKMGEIEQR